MSTQTDAKPDTLVTAVEVQRAWTRLTPMRKTGTLRLEAGHVAFEASDGYQHVRVPLDRVTDVVRHRGGFGFWASFEGKRYFVTPRARPRPISFNVLYALLRPFATTRYVWWSARDRRRSRVLTRRWLEILTRYDPASGRPHPATAKARGLPGVIRIPIRITLTSWVLVLVPIAHVVLESS
jgi:hypothetical protein